MKLKRLIILLTTVFSLNMYCQQADAGQAKQAIVSLKNLGSNAQAVQTRLNAFNYGPYQIVTKCSVCTYHIIWCVSYDNYTYTWTFPDYGNFMSSFKGLNSQLQSDLGTFNSSFQPIQNWLQTTLPAMNTTFATLHNSTPSNLNVNLQAAITSVNNAQQQLTAAMQSLSGWNGTIQADFNAISNNSQSLQSYVYTDSLKIYKYTTGMACGGNDLTNQWKSMIQGVRNDMNSYMILLAANGVSMQGINGQLGYIQGPLVAIQSKLTGLNNDLQNGLITPNDAISKLDATVATGFWSEIAQFAALQFN